MDVVYIGETSFIRFSRRRRKVFTVRWTSGMHFFIVKCWIFERAHRESFTFSRLLQSHCRLSFGRSALQSSLRWIFGTLCKFHSAGTALTKPQRSPRRKAFESLQVIIVYFTASFLHPLRTSYTFLWITTYVCMLLISDAGQHFQKKENVALNVGQRNFLK